MPEYILRYLWILKCFFPVLTLAPNQHPSPQTPPLPKKHCSPGSFLRETHALALQLQRDLWRRFSSRAQFATVWRSRGTPEKTPQRVGALSTNPKTVWWFRKSWLTNQLSPGENLPIFSYIFHVEQGFGAWFCPSTIWKGHPLPRMQWSQSGCWDLFFRTEFVIFPLLLGRGGGQPKLCPLKRLQSHRFWRFETITEASKTNRKTSEKEAKKKRNKSYKKTFPYTLLSMKKIPIPTKTEKETLLHSLGQP